MNENIQKTYKCTKQLIIQKSRKYTQQGEGVTKDFTKLNNGDEIQSVCNSLVNEPQVRLKYEQNDNSGMRKMNES